MHSRPVAVSLRRSLVLAVWLPALVCAAEPERQTKDAAEQAREGDITHWIEYYQANRPRPAKEKLPDDVRATQSDAHNSSSRSEPTVQTK